MTEKDTKVEEVHDEEFYDDYNENDNYYIDKALGNIKDDPGSVRSRPRRIPVYKIQLEDKDKIPKMPEKILREPNDKEFQKKIDDLKAENEKKKKSIEEQIEKRRQERMGVKSDDKKNVFNQMKEINAKIKKLTEEINAQESTIQPIRNKLNDLNNKLKEYERYKFPMNEKKVATEIRKIQEKISFSAINVTQETELINRKALLEDYQKILKPYLAFRRENKEKLDVTKKPREERKKLYEERNALDKKIKDLLSKEQKQIEKSGPEINNINNLIEKLKKEKAENSEKIRQINNEWNQAWYEYNEQQKLIQYIKEATAKIKNLEKRDKKKKEGEKGEKGEKGDKKDKKENEKDDGIKIVEYKPNEKELKLRKFDDLKNYFISLLPKQEKEKQLEIKQNQNSSLSKDIQAGKLVKYEKKEEEYGTTGGKKGKKGKKPKEPKESRKQGAKNTSLVLDFDIIQRVTESGLTAPTKYEDIQDFLNELEKKRASVEKGETVVELSKKEEPKKDVKKEQTKKESKKEPKKEPKKEEKVEVIKKEEPKKEEKAQVIKMEEPKKEEPKAESLPTLSETLTGKSQKPPVDSKKKEEEE